MKGTEMILRGIVYSEVLDMDTGITIITPKTPGKKPPAAVYLFHGLGTNNERWTDSTRLTEYVEDYNAVIVMPEVGRSYYFDLRYGQKFFTYVADELPGLVARQFVVSQRREDTMVIGASMGANGALRCAFRRPERFGTCCALSTGLLYMREHIERLKALNNWDAVAKVYGPQRVVDFRCMFGEELTVAPEQEVMDMARVADAGEVKPRIFAACGTEDPFHNFNTRFRDEMRELSFDFTYEEWPGEHNSDFFDGALKRSLEFCFGK